MARTQLNYKEYHHTDFSLNVTDYNFNSQSCIIHKQTHEHDTTDNSMLPDAAEGLNRQTREQRTVTYDEIIKSVGNYENVQLCEKREQDATVDKNRQLCEKREQDATMGEKREQDATVYINRQLRKNAKKMQQLMKIDNCAKNVNKMQQLIRIDNYSKNANRMQRLAKNANKMQQLIKIDNCAKNVYKMQQLMEMNNCAKNANKMQQLIKIDNCAKKCEQDVTVDSTLSDATEHDKIDISVQNHKNSLPNVANVYDFMDKGEIGP